MQKIIKNKLFKQTQLAVGPMSKNCVDTIQKLSKKKKVKIILISSRRQIDSKLFGGGYVNNWNTKNYSKYINRFNNKNVYMARDHGGPWQNSNEIKKNLSLKKATNNSIFSLFCKVSIPKLKFPLKVVNDSLVFKDPLTCANTPSVLV